MVNFTISIDSVTVNHTEIKILSNTELVLVTSFDDIKIKQSTVRVALSYRYGLTATLSITTAGQTPARLLQQGTFPLQNVYTDVFVPQFISFTLQQREAGFQMYQIAASICIGALIFELFALVRNMRVTSLTLIGYLQWAYTLSLLDGIYPPNFGQFL